MVVELGMRVVATSIPECVIKLEPGSCREGTDLEAVHLIVVLAAVYRVEENVS